MVRSSGRDDVTLYTQDGPEIHGRVASRKQELPVAEGWPHDDLYGKSEPVGVALAWVATLFSEHL
ncbi:hypothetical protein ACV229_07810 [Burkholderia sp. MR1-5-21]